MKGHKSLSRRERQIMDIVYKNTEVTAAQVMEQLPNPPSYSAVRALLRVLEEKGHITHRQEGLRYIFTATVPREEARESALKHLVKTFFDGSTESAMAALLDLTGEELSAEDYDRLLAMIAHARREGR